MSTKIYDAYKLVNGNNDLSSLMTIADELKQDIEIEARKEITYKTFRFSDTPLPF